MLITLIAAVGANRVIGHEGKIPWHVPEDFAFFKKVTAGCPCIMGRKTFESLPGLLPGRFHLVLTRKPEEIDKVMGRVLPHQDPYHLLSMGIQYANNMDAQRVIIMGGEKVYREFEPLAHEIILTQVDYDGPGDTYFPEFYRNHWQMSEEMRIAPNAIAVRYARRLPGTLMPFFP